MSQQNIKVEFLTKERIKEACHVLTEGFIKENPVYKRIGATYDEAFAYFQEEMEHSINDRLTIALTINGKIIAVSISHDMHDYPKLQNTIWNEGKSKFIIYEKKQIEEVEDYLYKSNYERGVAVYANYAGVLPQYLSQGIGAMMLLYTVLEHKKRGYKILYATATSEFMIGFITNFGCKLINKKVSNEPGMKGTVYALLRGEAKDYDWEKIKKKSIKPKL